jgi:hypothetical protein
VAFSFFYLFLVYHEIFPGIPLIPSESVAQS